jgi:hypothetical protein
MDNAPRTVELAMATSDALSVWKQSKDNGMLGQEEMNNEAASHEYC